MTKTYRRVAQAMSGGQWGFLDFFAKGHAEQVADRIDARVATGAHVLPPARHVFRALDLTPPQALRAVILGQDPYPTPGDAHGLAFSVAGDRKIPASLRTVFATLEIDLDMRRPETGDLCRWARNGVLLLNVSLTVEAGKANSHRNIGWEKLTSDILDHANNEHDGIIFMLWGKFAQKAGKDLDRNRHCLVETAHPSPLAHGPGNVHRFTSAHPFRQAKRWLEDRDLQQIDWSL